MKHSVAIILFFMPLALSGQAVHSQQDTLPPAYMVASRSTAVQGGQYTIEKDRIKKIASPAGEADVIKYIQTLPGIATGAEGSSSIYVRGGNIGNNLITLDGVPIYSSSHLFGLTTSMPQYIVNTTDFFVGGFPSDEGNVTASHIRMTSADGDFQKTSGEVSASNFLISTGISTPIVKDKVSFTGAFRISPMGLEYKAFKNLINRKQTLFTDLSIFAADIFGKAKYLIDSRSSLSVSVFGTTDAYSIKKESSSDNAFGWANTFVNAVYDRKNLWGFDMTAQLSYNFNSSRQTMKKMLDGVHNKLGLISRLNEVTLSANAEKKLNPITYLKFGLKARTSIINPGSFRIYESISTNRVNNRTTSMLLTANGQIEWKRPELYEFRVAGRLNAYFCKLGRAPEVIFNPELSLMGKVILFRLFGIEATADYLTQHNHTLEGIPLGWSLDMIVPADKIIRPEHSYQAYLGMFGDFSKHHISLGGYAKYMQNLVYYPDARNLFSQGISGWHESVEIGTGTSYGLEMMYEKTGEILTYKFTYTLSKTDRLFKNLNRGNPFPAKFDRRHIVNAQIDYAFIKRKNYEVSFSSQFTFQSGHWESLADGYVTGWRIASDQEIQISHLSGVNNYKIPDYIRWDNSLNAQIHSRKVSHSIKLGVFNTLNRHNVFTLLYDETTDKWQTLSLIPIMPSLYYSIAF